MVGGCLEAAPNAVFSHCHVGRTGTSFFEWQHRTRMNKLGRLRTAVRGALCNNIPGFQSTSALTEAHNGCQGPALRWITSSADEGFRTAWYDVHASSSVFTCGLAGHTRLWQQKPRTWCAQAHEQSPTLPKILQDFDSKDTRVSSLAMDSFILLWQPENVDSVRHSFTCCKFVATGACSALHAVVHYH